jgi:hypothetical protein
VISIKGKNRILKRDIGNIVMAGEERLYLSSSSVSGIVLTVESSLAVKVTDEQDASLEGAVKHAGDSVSR